jgi:spore germination cell wall hydrolase CwlJ-like protein
VTEVGEWPERVVASFLLVLALSTPGRAGGGERATDSERRCLALALYWEAREDGRDGMVAVGWVVLNRLRSPDFPRTVCAVVREGGEKPPCQFSYWCDGRRDTPTEPKSWALAQDVARELLADPPPDPTRGALFFHRGDGSAPWRAARTRTVALGQHVYYR